MVNTWVVVKEYDVENMKTNIVSVEPYADFVRKNSPDSIRAMASASTDIIQAIDAIGAWKKAKEMHDERY